MSMLSGFKAGAAQKPASAIPEETVYFTEGQVKGAMKELYNGGHRENIFVLITTEMITDMRDYFQAEGRGETALKYAIADSFGKDQKQYPRSCCHVRSFKKVLEFDENGNGEHKLAEVNSKTRMYVYDTETESAWWEHLVSLLSNS